MARKYTLQRPTTSGASGIDFAEDLNDQQLAAVSSPPGPALVIAGAGSGKTRTLTYRVAYLLDRGIEPRNILLLTFTNKAAKEMQERVRALVPRDVSEMWGGTFHSVGNRILRRHAEEIGFTKSFSIMDRDDQKSLMNTVIAECEIDTTARRFPKPDVLISIFSLIENTGVALHDLLEERYPYFEEWVDEIAQVEARYRVKKRQINSVDFDDLLVLSLQLLQENDELRRLYQKRFQYVLVDEFQDTNYVQSELVDLLVGEGQSLMVVGDDAQSIYSWRGADMDNILSFPERYPDARVYRIEKNYRSVPEILELSNSAIKANRHRFEKDLQAAREGGAMMPALVSLEDPNSQAQFVAQRILELREEGVELEEIAVLYRAHHQSMTLQMELKNRGIPFQITSGLRFFEQAHIKDVAAFMRFVTNRRDEVSFKRMACLLPGIGAKSADKLWRGWRDTPHATADSPLTAFSDILAELPVPRKSLSHWEQLGHTLDELVSEDGFARPADMIFSILEGVYDEVMRESFDNYEHRRSDLEELMSYADRFDDILECLAQLSLMSAVDGDPSGSKAELDTEQIVLSSVHQAKGLEWRVVFVISLTDGMFPNGRVLDADDEHMLEEERRLFYVAITRAKDELYLTYPQINPKSYSGDVIQRPSRFLDDCPGELMEEWQVSGDW